jgi:acetoin utilization deacetylase AcuC-like enzyme
MLAAALRVHNRAALPMSRLLTRRTFLSCSSAVLLGREGARAQVPRKPFLAFSDAASLRHEPSAGHPENPRRLEAVLSVLRSMAADARLTLAPVAVATDDDILLVHSESYLATVQSEVRAGRRMLSTGDTELSAGSLDAAYAAAGAVRSAVDAVMTGGARSAFCAVRPPGHHASRDRGMGFCLFNNVAIGARHAQRRYGIERVLIADWDVHHGNGTQAIFESDGSVLFFDTHQHPWYPGTGLRQEAGVGKGRGRVFNRPFPAGSGRAEILTAFREELVPAAAAFRPLLVMISAGFDSRVDDPLGRFRLADQDFADLTAVVMEIASEHAGGRVVSVLEGGYAPDGLASATRAHVTRLCDA